MTRMEIEDLAKLAGKEGAKEVLLLLGMDVSHPLDVQKDFAHLRMWRQISERMMQTAVVTFFISLGTAIAALSWLGFKIKVG